MNSPVPSLISCLVVVATLLLGASSLRADELLAHATSEMFWVARVVPAEGSRGEYTVIRGRPVGAEGGWSEIARPAARVVSLAHRGRELAALLDSGVWMLLWKDGSTIGAAPQDGAKLVCLASDDQTIWAIGSGGSGIAATTRSSTQKSRPMPPPAGTEAASKLGIYRLDRGSWVHCGWLPPDIVIDDLPHLSLVIVRQLPMLSMRRSDQTVRTLVFDAGQWRALDSLDVGEATQIKLLADGDGALLWAGGPAGGGRVWLRGERWSSPRELSVQGPLAPAAPRTIALAGENLRLLFTHDRGLFEQTIARDGTAMYPASELPALRSATSETPNRILTAAAAAMVMLVVLTSMRRDGTAAETAAEAGVHPAPLFLRFVAGAIDASPLLVTMFIIFRDLDPGAREFEKLFDSMTPPFYTALGAYLVYTWIAEMLFGRTIGKMLFGMRVVSIDGSRPTAGAIFTRNALRLVDVTMLAVPLILVVLSPLRQRIGDIAAQTVVVRGPVTPKPPEDKP